MNILFKITDLEILRCPIQNSVWDTKKFLIIQKLRKVIDLKYDIHSNDKFTQIYFSISGERIPIHSIVTSSKLKAWMNKQTQRTKGILFKDIPPALIARVSTVSTYTRMSIESIDLTEYETIAITAKVPINGHYVIEVKNSAVQDVFKVRSYAQFISRGRVKK